MGRMAGKGVQIPDTELYFSTSRSGGPGGQHVNKVNSRVTLHFNVKQSPSLSPYQKKRIQDSLGSRINKEGVLRIHSQKYRSQASNRQDLLERVEIILNAALTPKPPRVATKISSREKEKRLQEKKRHAQVKRGRSRQQVEES